MARLAASLLLVLAACTPTVPESEPPEGGAGGQGCAGGTCGGGGGAGGEIATGGTGGALPCAPVEDPACDEPRSAAFLRLGADGPAVSIPLCGVPFRQTGEIIVELFLRPGAIDGERALLAWPADDGTIGLEIGLSEGRPVARFQTGAGPIEIQGPPRLKVRTDRWSHLAFVVRFPTEHCSDPTPFAAQFLLQGDAMGEQCVAFGGVSRLGSGHAVLGRPAAGGRAVLPYEGDLDELRIWSEGALVFVLSERIVRRLAGAPDLVSAWDFDAPAEAGPLFCDDASGLHGAAERTPLRLPGGPLAPMERVEGCSDVVRGARATDDLSLCEVAIAARIDGDWTQGICGPGFGVCGFDDPALLTLGLAAALELPGCFVYDASLFDDGSCGPCDDTQPQLGIGAACRWDLPAARGGVCLGDGTLTAYDPAAGSPSCGPVPMVSGIACCRTP